MFLPLLQQHRSVENGFPTKPGDPAHGLAPNSGTGPDSDGEKQLTSPLWKRKLGLEFRPDLSRSSRTASVSEGYFDGLSEQEKEGPIDAEIGQEQREMHFQQTSSNGPAADHEVPEKPHVFTDKSSSLPFGQDVNLSDIGSASSYLTALTVLQQVVYTLSDQIFTYSPETFDLDVALKEWKSTQEINAFGYTPGLQVLETRAGAGSIALGYVFSPDFNLRKRHIPQSIVASSSTLSQMQRALDQLSLLYSLASPFVAHVAAVDYASDGLVSDYVSALSIADELGLGLVASGSAEEVQHMSLLATIFAKILPTIHVFDGMKAGRETLQFKDALGQSQLYEIYESIIQSLAEAELRHSDNEGRLLRVLKHFNDALGTSYLPFEYLGPESPDSVLVVFGTAEATLAPAIASAVSKKGTSIGVINVRVYRPFVEEAFLEVLPDSVKTIGVLGQVEHQLAVADPAQHSLLYKDILATVNFATSNASVVDIKYCRSEVLTAENMLEKFRQLDGAVVFTNLAELEVYDFEAQSYRFWDTDDSPSVTAPLALGQMLSANSSRYIRVSTGHDNLVQGGVVRTDIQASTSAISTPITKLADVTVVGNEKLLGDYEVLNTTEDEGILIVKLPGWKDDDLEKKIPVGLRQGIATKKVQLYILDPTASATVSEDPRLEALLTQLAFMRLTGAELSSSLLQKVTRTSGNAKNIEAIAEELDHALRPVEVPESWATVEPEVGKISLPTDVKVNSFARFERVDPQPPTQLENWVAAAKAIAFKEAYGTRTSLRPDLGIKTAVVHVKERRRLTPLTYDRNIFHIEFDLGSSGLTYAIGEALGIHAENDKAEVEEFIKWYGLDPEDVVQVPSREDPDVLESRTVYQALIQNVDIFGRPPKRFYEALADFASDDNERKQLLTLASAAGATEFKRRAEVDTITFADILIEFTSARPSFHDIVRIVSPMKRREYSIASSQHVTPNSVALLIVTVNWVDPKGRDRFGQATRYLNGLEIGAPVTVSVKPSVMKLPPKSAAPVIMAGLGTGLAPFRAFVQERAYQKQVLGQEIGAVMLYLGSRHQREEYLYGEEWEAYMDAGIITHIGAAFSRDQAHKIYIQNRMRESLDHIRHEYFRNEGSFYLCGPTWPVPDVTEVLQEAVEVEEKSKGARKVDSRRAIEGLKEQGRFVLEVY